MSTIINVILHTVHCAFSIFFVINIGIGAYFVYSDWYVKKDDEKTPIETIIY